MKPEITRNGILATLATITIPPACSEARMQACIAQALERAGIHAMREYKLAPRCRIDFFCEGNIGIECKVGTPSRAAVAAQLERYAETGALSEIILCMQRVILPVEPPIPYHFLSLNCNHGMTL